MKIIPLSKNTLWSPLIPCFLLFLLRVSDCFMPYYNTDELTNSLFAKFIVEGRMNLYEWLGNSYLYTHYLYAFAYFIGKQHVLGTIRFIHLIWCLGTTVAIYYAGKAMTKSHYGAFWSAMFYVGSSLSFMSKDFRAALSESFSLLPLSLACLCFFHAIKKNKPVFTFLASFFIGLASLFKSPAGIIIVPVMLTIFLFQKKKIGHFLLAILGLLLGIISPFLFVDDIANGIHCFFGNLDSTMQYIKYYDDLPFIYYFFKYFVRAGLIIVSFPLAGIFVVMTFRSLVYQKEINKNILKKEELIFLILGLFCMSLVVNIGRRIFYHYFVFTLPFVSLLAAYSFEKYWHQIMSSHDVKKKVLVGLAFFVPVIGFSVESYTGFSTMRKEFPGLVSYIRETTNVSDPIYIWGNLPQIYYEAQRDPASTFFWSDALAGISPGTPTMEYMRGKNQKISLEESMTKDLKPAKYNETEPNILCKDGLLRLTDRELISDAEILESIENKYWRKVFEDFAAKSPVLFLDSSPTGIRGFDRYPIERYEILKRYLARNYHFETTLDKILVYRRN